MSKETLKGLIDLIDDSDMDTIYKVLVRFVPEEAPYVNAAHAIDGATEEDIQHDEDIMDAEDF